MNTLLKEILKKSRDTKKVINLRKYDNDDYFYSGYILDYNDEVVVIQHFTDYGKDDGLVFEKIENIENIEYDEDYSESLQLIIQNTKEIDIPNITKHKFDLDGNWKLNILKMFLDKNVIIIVENYKKEKICGFVKQVNETELLINPINKGGLNEGMSLYKLDDISSIQPDDLECRKRLILYKLKNKK